jgi:APA family basic amino acid/polyamine antiporter
LFSTIAGIVRAIYSAAIRMASFPSTTNAPASTEGGLLRQLGLASATAAVAGESIAVGIFLTPAGMAKALGSPFWLLIVWIVVGILTVCGALCYGELAARFPRSGGIYVYLLETCGRRIAFLYGWMCLLVLDPGLTAALAVGLAGYVTYIFPASALAIKVIAVSVIWALCLLNILSVRVSAGFLRWTTWLKLGLLGLLVVWALAFRLGSWTNFAPFVEQRSGSLALGPALGAAMVGAFFSFGGWWDVSKIAGEVRDPGRNLPRAMLLGTLIVTSVYILVSAVFLYLVPLAQVSSDQAFVAQAGAVLFGRAGGNVFAAIVIVCVLGGLAAFMMSAPRVYYAMAQDGLFLHAVARIHSRFGTPVYAILIQGVIASVLVLTGTFEKIIAYFIFVAVVFLTLTGAGLFILRSRDPETEPAFLTPWYPLPLAVFLVLMSLLLVLLALHRPQQALLGSAVVLAGLPVYAIFQRKSKLDSVQPLTRDEILKRLDLKL